MSLQIVKVSNADNPENEYIRLKATANVNLENYAIVDNTYTSNGGVSNTHKHFFRLPKKMIPKGDYVRLYTGKGEPKMMKNENYSSHYFYCGSDKCIWNDRIGDVAELLKIQSVNTKDVEKQVLTQ